MNKILRSRPASAPLIALLALVFSAPAVRAADKPHDQFDRWFSVLMQDQPAGWMRITVTQQAEGGPIETKQQMKLSMRRGPATIHIEQSGRFLESADGKPIEASSSQKLGSMAVEQQFQFKGDKILVTSKQGAQTSRIEADAPDRPWLTPAAAGRYVEQQVEQGAEKVEFATMDPTLGMQVFTVTRKLVGREKVDVLGKTVPAIVWDGTVSIMPGVVSREYLDEAGQPVKMTIEMMPGMKMTILEADRTIAEQQVNPPELLASTLIKPDKPIANPRQTRQAVYELHFKAGRPPAAAAPAANGDAERYDLPRAGYQRVVWANEQTARVVVDLDDAVPPQKDTVKDEHRQASISVNSDDAEVKKLLEKALGDEQARKRVAADFKQEPDALTHAAKAELLRRFVHGFIDAKNLSVGFATASEVARTGEGDCTEHGVLLAALLRAADIPSRTATGLIYVDEFVGEQGVFGYHMWTQAWLEDVGAGAAGGRWVDLDATLGDDTPYDAAHILLGVSAMNDVDSMNDMVTMSSVIGRLDVKVIEVK